MTCEELLTTLTLEQKCALLSGADTFCSRALPGQGIPSLWLSDGPSGVRKQEGASDHLGINPSAPATCFPTCLLYTSNFLHTSFFMSPYYTIAGPGCKAKGRVPWQNCQKQM